MRTNSFKIKLFIIGMLLAILTIISFNSFGQTYDDLMSIKDVESFKKLVITEGYSLMSMADKLEAETEIEIGEDDRALMDSTFIMYGYGNDEIVAFYDRVTPTWMFTIRLPVLWKTLSNNIYKPITDRIKSDCTYMEIKNYNGMDLACYRCEDSSLDGNIGFAVQDDAGWIRYFPKE